MDKDFLIECKDLAVGYNKTMVRDSISLRIPQGSYIALTGKNGAGKSTFIKTLLGFLKPVKGEICYADDIKGIGYLPQQNVAQRNFPTSVSEVILSGRQNKIRFFYSKEDKKIAKETAIRFGVYTLYRKRYSDLSGGQQQRVLLARALCSVQGDRQLLVLDEPLTGLDIETQKAFYDTMKKLNTEEGVTILMISHDNDLEDKGITHILDFGERITLKALKGDGDGKDT